MQVPIHTDVHTDSRSTHVMRLAVSKNFTSSSQFEIKFAIGEEQNPPIIGGLVQNLTHDHALWFTSSLVNLLHEVYWTRFVIGKYHKINASLNFARKSIEKMFINGPVTLKKYAPARPTNSPADAIKQIRGSAAVLI